MAVSSARALLIVAVFLSFSAYRGECGCSVKTVTLPVYYDNGQFMEECRVKLDACYGNCYNSYTHKPHKQGDYTSADRNCGWSYKKCESQSSTTISKDLYSCNPVNQPSGTSSQFDTSNPWSVNVVSADSCQCSSETAQSVASYCPLDFE